jgi:hypothetical protein
LVGILLFTEGSLEGSLQRILVTEWIPDWHKKISSTFTR